jgi:hypothetical protein
MPAVLAGKRRKLCENNNPAIGLTGQEIWRNHEIKSPHLFHSLQRHKSGMVFTGSGKTQKEY